MIRCLYLIAAFCLAVAPGLAAQNATIATVSIGRSPDAGRIAVLEYRQDWQYSGAACYVGSFLLFDARGPRDIVFERARSAAMTIRGGTMQGVDSTLLDIGRSESFVIAAGGVGRMLFYRSVYLYAPCDAFPDAPPYKLDPNFVATPWDVDDNCEWLVQLRRSSDDAPLLTLDSVGVPIHDDPVADVLYGANVNRKRHCVVLPSSLAGQEVYLQVLALRHGPLQRPMRLQSHHFRDASEEEEALEPLACADFDPRSPEVFNFVVRYLDSVKVSTGWQVHLRNYPMTPQQQNFVKQRYYLNPRPGEHGSRSEINVRPQQVKFWRDMPDGTREYSVSLNDAIQFVEAQPDILRQKFRLTFTLREAMSVRCYLSSIAGRELQQLWTGALNSGAHTLDLTLDNSGLADDTYLLFVSDTDGWPAASMPVTVAVD